ncbi:MAG: glycoside hydrolase family 2 protein [Opitutaceae bacterium]
MADSPEFVHAMGIESVEVDGFPVVLHYGEIRPDFEDNAPNPYRDRRSLDGDWKFSFDPEAEGIAENWPTKPDIQDWTTVQVPHCWDMMPGGRFWDWSDRSPSNPPFYDGTAWYRREFDHQPSTEQKQYRIEFLSVQQRGRIFLNGTLLALHEGSGQPFSVDISEALRPGKNTLAVQVIRLANFRPKEDGDGFHELYPAHTQHPKAPDNWPYAGINRSVTLITENPITIRKTQVRTADGLLEAAVCITNRSSKSHKVKANIDSSAITNAESQVITIRPNQNRVLKFSAALKQPAKKWSTESPNLHTLTTRLEINNYPVDTLRTEFGIRSFKTIDHQFALNESLIFLKGVAFYEEHPKRGNALLPSDHEEFFRLSDEADANFIRLHVGQRDPYVYQLADKLGFMLCAEWGGFWYTEKSMGAQTEDKQSVYQSHAHCTVWDLMNHPSVVLWGLNNESHQFCDEYAPFLKVGRDIVETYDKGGRPITWAAWHPHKGEPHFEYADAVGFNEYRGAMDPFEELAPDLVQATEENPNKPLIILENGAWSTLGSRGKPHQKNTEDWQADLLKRQHKVLTDHRPRLAGYTYWLLTDYRSRKTYTGNKHQNGWSRMGMYNEFSQPKLVRNVFRDLEWPTTPIADSID